MPRYQQPVQQVDMADFECDFSEDECDEGL